MMKEDEEKHVIVFDEFHDITMHLSQSVLDEMVIILKATIDKVDLPREVKLTDKLKLSLFYQAMVTIGSSLISSTYMSMKSNNELTEVEQKRSLKEVKSLFKNYFKEVTSTKF